MIRKILGAATFYLGTALTLMYTVEGLKYRIDKIAETETVNSAHHYVIVRAARGDYNSADAFEKIRTDYKFYKTIEGFHN